MPPGIGELRESGERSRGRAPKRTRSAFVEPIDAVVGRLRHFAERRRALQAVRRDVGDQRLVLGVETEPGRGHGVALFARAQARSRRRDDEKAGMVERRVENHVVDTAERLTVRIEDLVVLETSRRHHRKHVALRDRTDSIQQVACRLPADRRRGRLSKVDPRTMKEKGVTTTAADAGTEAERIDAPTVERLAEKAHDKVDQAAAGVAQAEREIRRAAEETAERIRRSEEELAELIEQNVRKVREYIEKNPLRSAGIAFAAGILPSSPKLGCAPSRATRPRKTAFPTSRPEGPPLRPRPS